MTSSAFRSRLLLLILIATNAWWMFAIGWLLMDEAQISVSTKEWRSLLIIILVLALLVIIRSFVFSVWLEILRKARLGVSRAFALLEFVGMSGLFYGAVRRYHISFEPRDLDIFSITWYTGIQVIVLAIASVAVPLLARFCARGGQLTVPFPSARFFVWERGHVSSRDARIYLLAGMTFVGLIGATIASLSLQRLNAGSAIPIANYGSIAKLVELLVPLGVGLIAGIGVTIVQGHWHRALGFVPWAFGLLAVALMANAIWPKSEWPLIVLGFSAGLPHCPLLVAMLAAVPPRQRFAAMFLHHAVGGFAVIILTGFALLLLAPFRLWILAAFALIATPAFTYLLFRPFIEQLNEIVFRPLWYPMAFGPGATGLPTRGPVLIICNHSAMFDPVWIAGVVPIRTRAMMLSTFMDKPFLKWLTGTVYKAIRVDERAYRRHYPEIDAAVATLKSGESVMIFPEAWMRRKEEQPLRRFAQGVFKILEQVPQTPVIACWVEDGWGSFASYKYGPPGKGKPFDILKRIRVGISEPEILTPEILATDKSTRKYLMERVLHARTYLGLPAHPMPQYGSEKECEPTGGGE